MTETGPAAASATVAAPAPVAAVPPVTIPPPSHRRIRDIVVLLVALALAIGIIAMVTGQWNQWVGGATRQTTDDAYVRGDITPLSAKVDGYVRAVNVDDFQRVKKGDVLVVIDDEDYRAKVAQAAAALLGSQAAIENIKARKEAQHAAIAEAQSAIIGTQADVERTQQEATRQRTLLATTYGTQQKVEQADAEAKRLAATLTQNRAALEAQQRQMAVLDSQELQLRADAKAKQAELDLANINLGYTRITAPVDGMISERAVRPGQYIHNGSQVTAVVPLENVWVVANYKETQLTHVALGQKAEIQVDTFPGIPVSAHVDSISPASGSQFSLLPPDNATGNFTKVVQRIPVKLRLDPNNPLKGHLLPGMSVLATILTDTTPPPP